MNLFSSLKVANWERFKQYRREMKKPMTRQAEVNMLKKLQRMLMDGQDPNAVLEQSIDRGWQGVFPVKERQDHVRDLFDRGYTLTERDGSVGGVEPVVPERFQERRSARPGGRLERKP